MVESRTEEPRKGSSTGTTMGRPDEFFRRGVQYYVMARRAARSRYAEVAGNLFHQGFEMMLKASILTPLYEEFSRGWTPDRPEDRRAAAVEEYTRSADKLLASRGGIGHQLAEAWRRFKALHPDDELDAFDEVVGELSKFWQVRYPGFPNGQPLQITFSPVKRDRPAAEQRESVNSLYLCLEEMDELFAAIAPADYTIHAIRLAIERGFGGSGREAYEQENLHKLW